MTKAQADHLPERFVKSGGKIQFNYNVVETTRKNEDGTITPIWKYDYVEVSSIHRETLIKAMIHDKYSKDDELALINNNILGDIKSTARYATYQQYRKDVKKIVDTIMQQKR